MITKRTEPDKQNEKDIINETSETTFYYFKIIKTTTS